MCMMPKPPHLVATALRWIPHKLNLLSLDSRNTHRSHGVANTQVKDAERDERFPDPQGPGSIAA